MGVEALTSTRAAWLGDANAHSQCTCCISAKLDACALLISRRYHSFDLAKTFFAADGSPIIAAHSHHVTHIWLLLFGVASDT